jgi:membrane associated rhomboid family serine protease
MLDAIFGLIDAYMWLVEGPLAVYRLVNRIRHPTPDEKAAAGTPEMKRFWRNVWLLAIGWFGLSIVVGLGAGSPWFAIIALVMGLLLLPGLVERRFDKLVAALRS